MSDPGELGTLGESLVGGDDISSFFLAKARASSNVCAQYNLVGAKSQMMLGLQFVGRGACKCFKNAMQHIMILGGLQAILFTLLCWMRLIHFAVKSAQWTRHVTFLGTATRLSNGQQQEANRVATYKLPETPNTLYLPFHV